MEHEFEASPSLFGRSLHCRQHSSLDVLSLRRSVSGARLRKVRDTCHIAHIRPAFFSGSLLSPPRTAQRARQRRSTHAHRPYRFSSSKLTAPQTHRSREAILDSAQAARKVGAPPSVRAVLCCPTVRRRRWRSFVVAVDGEPCQRGPGALEATRSAGTGCARASAPAVHVVKVPLGLTWRVPSLVLRPPTRPGRRVRMHV
ncbi:hypothetical protein GY45DRAFT_506809 [Cubamyces sp. BRFM 1775]|nr:hypothetical protein GY45DRAFT_506809 [Cubamyces sp. BRFM 1775]